MFVLFLFFCPLLCVRCIAHVLVAWVFVGGRLRRLKYIIHLIWILEKHLSKNLRVNANRGPSTGRGRAHSSWRGDSRHAVSGQIARGLFGRSASLARASAGGRQPEPMASNLLISASPCTRKIPSTGLRLAGRWRRNRGGRRWPPRAAP